jgi:hypothetical protein
VDSSREQLGTAHEKIAQLETQLARLKRGFDPEPIANPISEEQHRQGLAFTRKVPSHHLIWYLMMVLGVVAMVDMYAVVLVLHGPPVHPVMPKKAGPMTPKSSTSP